MSKKKKSGWKIRQEAEKTNIMNAPIVLSKEAPFKEEYGETQLRGKTSRVGGFTDISIIPGIVQKRTLKKSLEIKDPIKVTKGVALQPSRIQRVQRLSLKGGMSPYSKVAEIEKAPKIDEEKYKKVPISVLLATTTEDRKKALRKTKKGTKLSATEAYQSDLKTELAKARKISQSPYYKKKFPAKWSDAVKKVERASKVKATGKPYGDINSKETTYKGAKGKWVTHNGRKIFIKKSD